MNALEQNLLKAEAGVSQPKLAICSRTRIDAGRWWRGTPLWLCLTDGEVVAMAVARRRYLQRVPLAECAESYYCHASGELVIAPAESLTFSRFATSPREALEFLRALGVYPKPTTDPDSATTTVQQASAPAPPRKVAAKPLPIVTSEDSDEVARLLASPELKAMLSEAERAELAHLSADEIRAILDSDDDDAADEPVPVDATAPMDAELKELLESDEFLATFTAEELEEFKKMSPDELRAMMVELEDDDDDEVDP